MSARPDLDADVAEIQSLRARAPLAHAALDLVQDAMESAHTRPAVLPVLEVLFLRLDQECKHGREIGNGFFAEILLVVAIAQSAPAPAAEEGEKLAAVPPAGEDRERHEGSR